ncbi:hypothetical protein [Halorussus ruber]|nr:hypothetical protein [Halorussus ruber]
MTGGDEKEDEGDELVLEGQTVVNGPDIRPTVGKADDESDGTNE